jgi:acyl dehydratase
MTDRESADPDPLAQGLTFEKMKVGLRFRTPARTITETDLVNFVNFAGFTDPLFLDSRHGSESGYAGRLVPGALTFVISEGLVLQTNVLLGTGLAFMHTDLDIKGPVYVGDTLEVVVEVTESRASSKPGRGVVTSRNSVRNQRGEEVLVYTPVRLVRGEDYLPASRS